MAAASAPATVPRCPGEVRARPARAFRPGRGRRHNAPVLDVILFQPEIPPNTGNVIRLCANSGAALHLVRPLGFALEDRRLRRAGLDYHEYARVAVHDDLDACLAALGRPRVFAFTSAATRAFTAPRYAAGDALLFGRETSGLPAAVLDAVPAAQRLRIPMRPQSRSLNLSNAVAVAVYEVWRQLGWTGCATADAGPAVAESGPVDSGAPS